MSAFILLDPWNAKVDGRTNQHGSKKGLLLGIKTIAFQKRNFMKTCTLQPKTL